MKVKRIVTNIKTTDPELGKDFYETIFGLDVAMDLGWIKTYANVGNMPVQISIATQGGSDTPVPDISIEVDDIETAINRIKKHNIKFEYGPIFEPWGVYRFYVRDPFGKLINVIAHISNNQ
ncbi:VOC family protein [Marinicellulosiphila megalodicopiae]|uniref:VOC family protein n=1 Tax=Marinicellulosiphila megalodicopiae TaxID=2724896 RepID=UPI003BAFF476